MKMNSSSRDLSPSVSSGDQSSLRSLTAAAGLHEKIAQSHPSLTRGRVWCTRCGHTLAVNTPNALARGWPKCCGYTMTIDSPEERAARAEGRS